MTSHYDRNQLLVAIAKFSRADTLAESEQLIEAHPELLTEETDDLLAQLEQAAEDNWIIQERRALLRDCRQLGIKAAFIKRKKAEEYIPEEFRFVKATFPPEEWEQMWGMGLMRLLGFPSNQMEYEQALTKHPELKDLVTQTFENSAVPIGILEYNRAKEWSEKKRIVQKYPQLLSNAADELLCGQIEDAFRETDTRSALHYVRLLDLLRRCRQIGVDAAFAEQMANDVDPN
jgi:hypothetical protein